VKVSELAPGLWRWTAPHPAWRGGADWEQDVGCVYYEAADATVLIDPLVPPERDQFFEALDRDVRRRGLPISILLTVPWHARSSAELAERYETTAHAPEGVEPFALAEVEETVWWLPGHRALVVGESLFGSGGGELSLCPDTWVKGERRAALRRSLLPLLELAVERVLVSHGEPVLAGGHVALEQALRA
jgi:glyoxylase-like metal-dependent hydrolase (beta-lactamase superfamily II)